MSPSCLASVCLSLLVAGAFAVSCASSGSDSEPTPSAGAAGSGAGGAAGSAGISGGGTGQGAGGAGGTGGQGGIAGSGGGGGAAGEGGSGGGALGRHDAANEAAYANGWANGSNGGVGFDPWLINVTIGDTNRDGWFLGTAANNGTAPGSTNIDTDGKAFGLYANGNDGVSDAAVIAYRPFGANALQVGERFVARLDNGLVDPGGIMVGFSLPGEVPDYGHLYAAFPGSTTRFAFVLRAGSANYETWDGGDYHDTGVSQTYGGLAVVFELTGADSYQLTIDGGNALAGTLGGVPGTPLHGVAFVNYIAGAGVAYDFFFNSIATYVP